MSKKLKNSPIVEAVCEFKFADSTDDLTIYGDLRGSFINEYTKKKSITREESSPKEENGKLVPNIRKMQLQQYLSEDEKSLIQVGKDILTINKLKPYSTWSDFFPKIEKAFKNYIKVAKLNKIKRIGLRYINKIQFSDSSFTFKDNFKFLPSYDESFGEKIGPFFVGVHYPRNFEKDMLKIELTNAEPEEGYIKAVILDLDYFTKDIAELTVDNSLEWLKKLTPKLRQHFLNVLRQNWKWS